MKTHEEWLVFFGDCGFDPGTIWHLMSGVYELGLVNKAAG